jgi:hypothetical protein
MIHIFPRNFFVVWLDHVPEFELLKIPKAALTICPVIRVDDTMLEHTVRMRSDELRGYSPEWVVRASHSHDHGPDVASPES